MQPSIPICGNDTELCEHICQPGGARCLFEIPFKIDGRIQPTNLSHLEIILREYPNCMDGKELSLETEGFYMLANGSLSVKNTDETIDPLQFCFEYNEQQCKVWATVCKNSRYNIVPYEIGQVATTPLLLVTVIIYLSFKELRNLPGKCLACHLSSLIVAYISLIVVEDEMEPRWICINSGKPGF